MNKFPQWFIDSLYYEEDKEKARRGELKSRDRVTFTCPIHGVWDKDSYVYTHIRITDGKQRCGCFKCTQKSGGFEKLEGINKTVYNVVRKDRVKNITPYGESIVEQLSDPIDQERARKGLMNSKDYLYWKCEKHGPYLQQVASHISAGRGCPACGMEARAQGNTRRFKSKRVYPDWIIEEMVNEEDKEKARLGTLTSEDTVEFMCEKHGPYKQKIFNHINLTTGKRKHEGRTGCPMCVQGSYTSRAEGMVAYWLKDYEIERNIRGIIKSPSGTNMELDIYLPEEQFAVECDGCMFHEEDPNLTYNKWQLKMRGKSKEERTKSKKWAGYHKWKDDRCAEKGIRVLHVQSESVTDFPEETRAYILSELQKWKELSE